MKRREMQQPWRANAAPASSRPRHAAPSASGAVIPYDRALIATARSSGFAEEQEGAAKQEAEHVEQAKAKAARLANYRGA